LVDYLGGGIQSRKGPLRKRNRVNVKQGGSRDLLIKGEPAKTLHKGGSVVQKGTGLKKIS